MALDYRRSSKIKARWAKGTIIRKKLKIKRSPRKIKKTSINLGKKRGISRCEWSGYIFISSGLRGGEGERLLHKRRGMGKTGILGFLMGGDLSLASDSIPRVA